MFSSNATQVSNVNYIEDVFSTYLYKGNGSTQTITNGIDLSGKGGMVWTKSRTNANEALIYDTVRGVNKYIIPSSTQAAQTSSGTLTAFNIDGFTLGSNDNSNDSSTENSVSWSIAKAPKFFDVVTYTGNGTNRTIAHNLGSTPGFIIVKSSSAIWDWGCYHRSLGATKYLDLNTTDAAGTLSTVWNNTEPTSTVFSVGTQGRVNQNGQTYVAYLFAHDAGGFGLTGADNVISCGSFTTDSSGNASVTLGYEPQFLIQRMSDNVDDWYMLDIMRGSPQTFAIGVSNQKMLKPNLSNAEADTNGRFNPNATGFTVHGLAGNAVHIYIAIRRGPMKVPTSGTSVFAVDQGDGVTNPQFYAPFPQDSAIYRSVSVASNWAWFDRLRGQKNRLITNLTDAEGTFNVNMFDDMNRWFRGTTSTAYYSWMFRRAPSFFDEVCYTGTGSNTTQTHNLGVVPELIIVKRRDTTGAWDTYSAALSNTEYLVVNTTAAKATGATRWNSTTPTSTVFSLGTSTTTNASGGTYVAYLFATCAGVSKVGSYTGTGTTKQVDCGFTGGARFVLIKRTDSTGDWYVWDTARGIVSGNDPYLLLNSTAAEVTSTDYINTYSAGFEISSTAPAAINASGGTFIFLAIA